MLHSFIKNELKNESIVIVSEYFLTNSKLVSLINSYLIYSNYIDEVKIKNLLMTDIETIHKSDELISKLINELVELECEAHKKTILCSKVNNVLQKEEYNGIATCSFIGNLRFNGKSVQKQNLIKKIEMEKQSLLNRQRVAAEIDSLCSAKSSLGIQNCKEVTPLTNDLGSKIETACQGISHLKYEKFESDIVIYDENKIIIHRIDSLQKYIAELIKIKFDNEEETLFFRGHADIKWKLSPSIYREQWIKKEHILFRELIIRHPSSFKDQRSTFEKLTKMQHYELPTRLLDVTTNPLVALYFACSKHDNAVGEVHLFKVRNEDIKYYDSDTISSISNISRINNNFNLKLLPKDIKKFNECDEVKKLIHEIRDEKPYFEAKIIPKDLEKAIFVKPKLDNERIIRQGGAFILFGINGEKYKPAVLSNIYKPQKIHKFIIADSAKESIVKHLKLLGISHSSLFPELDKTSIQLRQEYL